VPDIKVADLVGRGLVTIMLRNDYTLTLVLLTFSRIGVSDNGGPILKKSRNTASNSVHSSEKGM
jgi:hypothetical protein